MRNSNSWTYKDKEITELSRTLERTDDSSDEADKRYYGFEDLPSDSIQPKLNPTRVSLMSKGSVDGGEMDLISEIDRKIKEHVGDVLHEVSGLSARVTQLESRMRRVENAVDDLKVAIEYNYGKTDGKLRELDNIMREVQWGVKDLRDKQEIAETQLQLAKLQLSKGDMQLGKQNRTSETDASKGDVPQKSHQLLANHVASPPQPASLPSSIPQDIHHHNSQPIHAATAPQLPSQLSENIIPSFAQGPQYESYSTSTIPTLETTYQQYHTPITQQSQPPPAALYQPIQPKPMEAPHQQYHMTSTQQSQLPPPTLHQPYQPTPQLPSVSQLDQQSQPPPPFSTAYFQAHHPSSQQPGVVPKLPSQSVRQSSLPPAGFPSTQQFYLDSTQQMHNQTPRRPYSEFWSGYSLPPEHSNSKNLNLYGESPVGSSSTNMKLLQSQLPTAKILPHAIPMASSVDSESPSGGNANRVPVDDVIDGVAAMGFRRDLVRATVKKMTENRQSVDLNAVLDKLMNNG